MSPASAAGHLKMAIADSARLAVGLGVSGPLRSRYVPTDPSSGITGFRVFYYHRVSMGESQPVYDLSIPQRLFTRQLEDLGRVYQFVPLESALTGSAVSDSGRPLAVLTFDDGYRDNYLAAFPILSRLSIPATIFLVTDLIGTNGLLWYDRVKRLLESHPGPSLSPPPVLGLPELDLRTAAHRRAAMGAITSSLKQLDDRARREAVEELAALARPGIDSEEDRDLLMTWDEAREMEQGGITFGSHTATHPMLSKVSDPAVLHRELAGSMDTLRRELVHPLPVLAYPGGDHNSQTIQQAREAGYQFAMANFPGVASAESDPMRIPRRGIGPRSSLYLRRLHSRHILLAETFGALDGARARTTASARRAASAGSRVSAAFDDKAEGYVRGRSTDPAFLGEQKVILSFVDPSPSLAIEFGSGSGFTALQLAKDGWSVVPTDLSMEMILRTRSLLSAEKPGRAIGYVRCDAQRPPFRDSSAQLLVSHGVLEYVEDQGKTLRALGRLLEVSGSLIITVPNRLAPASWVARILRLAAQARAGLLGKRLRRVPARHLLPRQMDALAREAGLTPTAGAVQTFTLLPAYLTPRPLLRLGNSLVASLPKTSLFRWWGTQCIARYTRRDSSETEA